MPPPCLVHLRTNYSHSKSLFPVWTHRGTPTWCCMKQYKCKACGLTYNVNNCELLSLLPLDVAALYPILPMYTHGSFHVNKDLSDNLELLMQTYANPKFVSTKLKKPNIRYLWRLETYLTSQQPTDLFAGPEGFTEAIFPPTSDSMQKYFVTAEKSPL